MDKRTITFGTRRLAGPAALLVVMFCELGVKAQAQQTRVYQDGNYFVREISGTVPVTSATRVLAEVEIDNVEVSGNTERALSYRFRMRTRGDAAQRDNVDAWPITVEGPQSGAGRGNLVLLKAEAPAIRGHHQSDLDLELGVPAGLPLTLHTGVGNVEARNVNGEIAIETGAGNITADHIQGPLQMKTGGGNISLGAIGGTVQAVTAGGNVDIGDAGQSVDVQSGGGYIHIQHAAGTIHSITGGGTIEIDSADAGVVARTGGGNIRLGKVAGAVRSSTGGGNIRVFASRGVHCQTGGGNIELRKIDGPVTAESGAGGILAEITAAGSTFGASLLQTGSGDITVYLPERLGVTVRATISGGRGHHLLSDFRELQIRNPDEEDDEVVAEGQLNGGGPELKLASSSSDIAVRKEP